ncbi:phenoloxidase-activating factor 2-like [Zophobas morio]|uniref:phenoloxidase-activating factor 2-like n=1 Tax=Zophobas morio TaxID=2755281 RepID=UPI003083BA2F
MLHKQSIVILVLGVLFSHVVAQGKSKDELIKDVFGTNSEEEQNERPVTTRNPPNLQPGSNTGTSGGIPGTGSCTCVPYYLCNNGSVNTNGEGIIDIRINEGPCENYIDVCCDKDSEVEVPLTPTPPPIKRSGCGHHNPDGIGFRITGNNDNEAQYGEFPWMVAVLREESIEGNPQKLNVYQCGGALIDTSVVVTAAHCVSSKKQFKIRAGEWDTQTKKELYPHQDREVESIIVHPQYYAGALYNDIALLFLKTPVDIAENVNVICLPTQGTNVDNARCYASGWGKDVFGKEGRYQVILKKIDLPVVPRDKCQESLRNTRLGKHFDLHKSFICAGGEAGKDTCKGDGGSPLVCPIPGEKNRYQQSGIVAWGIGCGDSQTPGVYVNVALFRNWIDEQMKSKGIETQAYEY